MASPIDRLPAHLAPAAARARSIYSSAEAQLGVGELARALKEGEAAEEAAEGVEALAAAAERLGYGGLGLGGLGVGEGGGVSLGPSLRQEVGEYIDTDR